VLFTGIRSLPSQRRSQPGSEQRRFLLDTYAETTIGAVTRLGERRAASSGLGAGEDLP
jgi:hypothetical protein